MIDTLTGTPGGPCLPSIPGIPGGPGIIFGLSKELNICVRLHAQIPGGPGGPWTPPTGNSCKTKSNSHVGL